MGLGRRNASLGYTTCFVDNIKKTEILYDKNGWLKSVKERVSTPYPDKLAQNIITKNFTYLKDAMFSFRRSDCICRRKS